MLISSLRGANVLLGLSLFGILNTVNAEQQTYDQQPKVAAAEVAEAYQRFEDNFSPAMTLCFAFPNGTEDQTLCVNDVIALQARYFSECPTLRDARAELKCANDLMNDLEHTAQKWATDSPQGEVKKEVVQIEADKQEIEKQKRATEQVVAVAQQESVPYELEKQGVYTIGTPFTDYYCRQSGRYDPACAKLIGFMMGKPKPGCYDGLNIPAAPKPPKVVLCNYVMPINRDAPQKYSRRYTYWYQRVPNNLDSLRVYGVDQFTSIAPVAVESCPKYAREADRLSGDRRGVPAYAASTNVGRLIRQHVYSLFDMPGTDVLVAESQQAQLMPDPPLHARNPQCQEAPAVQLTYVPKESDEGEYELMRRVAPVYPARALSRGIEGRVEVSFTISANGVVTDPVVVFSTSTLFNRAAIRTVLKYEYKPRVVNGQTVEVTGKTETVVFTINE